MQDFNLAVGGHQSLDGQHLFFGMRRRHPVCVLQAKTTEFLGCIADNLVPQFPEFLPDALTEQRIVFHVPGFNNLLPVFLGQEFTGPWNNHALFLANVFAQGFRETGQSMAELFATFRPAFFALRQQLAQLHQLFVTDDIAPGQLLQQRRCLGGLLTEPFVELNVRGRAMHPLGEVLDVIKNSLQQPLIRALIVKVHITQQLIQQIQNPPQRLVLMNNNPYGLLTA